MCTAITLQTRDFYFGRTLDYEHSWGEEVVVMPRNFPLAFRHAGTLESHYAILGMACVKDGYPLYFDGINEQGLAMAGLNFVGNAVYGKPLAERANIAQFEFIPWILARCASVGEARALLKDLNLTDTPFSRQLPPAQLHWIIADRSEAITVESVREGLRIYDNPVGVLTNNPSFDQQLFRLNDFMHLSPKNPENTFSENLELCSYSRGMGALGLPGDLSSQSRFIRAAFVKENSRSADGEGESVGQFFHILGSVEQVWGCCEVGEGQYERTLYTSCCNGDKGIYYYTTYENRRIHAVHLHRENLDAEELVRFPPVRKEQIRSHN